MTYEEKGKELENKMFHVILKNQSYLSNKNARKQARACVLIGVEEILMLECEYIDNNFWQQVKSFLTKSK